MNHTNYTESATGWGDLNAKVMVVGQSLCTACMNTGIPFTRGSGYLLDAALMLADLHRKDVFITNIIHCHPIHNRKSEPKEIRRCLPFLLSELKIVKPELVIPMGADAKQVFSAMSEKVTKKFKVHGVQHPAYYLHKGFEGAVDWMVNLALKMEKYSNA